MITPENRERIAARLLHGIQPMQELMLFQMAEAVENTRNHGHDREDWFCVNLLGYMGERMGFVLKRLIDEAAEADALRAEVKELRKRDAVLTAMEAAGVDNWPGMEFVQWPDEEEVG